MTTIIIRMDTLEKDFEFVKTGTYRRKSNNLLYNATFDNGMAYLESWETRNYVW